MTRLEDLLRETLTAREADAPDATTLVADVRRRVRRRRVEWAAGSLSAAAVTALAVSLAVVLPGQHTQSVLRQPPTTAGERVYPLPSDGWKPGDPSLDALTGGPFHAARRDGQVCAWLGETFRPMLWPAGYQVRLDPVELIAPDGTVVAQEGERVTAGGGGGEAKPGTPCAQPGEWTFFINSAPGLVEGILTGRLVAVGGPTSNPRPLPGQVTATGPRTSQTVPVGADGSYQLDLPPGTYTVTGTSPLYAGGQGTCRTADATITVTAGETDQADVICTEK